MPLWETIRRSFTRTADQKPALWLERQIVVVRWFGIVCAIPAILFIPGIGEQRAPLLSVALFCAAYNALLPWLARRQPERVSLISAMCDAIASGFFVSIAGFDTPLYLVLFSIIIASSMRFGLGFGLSIVVLFTSLDTASHALQGNIDAPMIAFRSSVLAVDAVLSAVLYRYAKQGDVLLKQTNEQLQAAIERLTQLDAMKSTFISTASHELRTPLTAIRSFSEFLVDNPELDGDSQEFARIINEESERLSRLVSDLLDLSRIESGTSHHHAQAYDAGSQLRHIYAEQLPLAERKELQLELELDASLPAVLGDPDAIHQVLLNLISNALKFTDRGQIVLSARLADHGVVISVTDTGAGICPEDRERIFDRFYQAGNGLTDKPSGTGLGLAIAKEVLEQHGARLEVESTPGKGSVFSFALPCAAPAEAAAFRELASLPG